MFILSLEQTHFLTVGIISYSKADVTTEQDVITAHVVVHNVLQPRNEAFVVDQVEVDLVIRTDIHSDVTPDEEDRSFKVQGVIFFPVSFVFSFVVESFVELNFF